MAQIRPTSFLPVTTLIPLSWQKSSLSLPQFWALLPFFTTKNVTFIHNVEQPENPCFWVPSVLDCNPLWCYKAYNHFCGQYFSYEKKTEITVERSSCCFFLSISNKKLPKWAAQKTPQKTVHLCQTEFSNVFEAADSIDIRLLILYWVVVLWVFHF